MMYIVTDVNIVLPLNVVSFVVTKDFIDEDINVIEVIVCNYYGVSVTVLQDWTNDTDAKKMVCFLLHHLLGYSLGALSKRYKINALFLRNCVKNIYKQCVLDADYNKMIVGFKNAFVFKDVLEAIEV